VNLRSIPLQQHRYHLRLWVTASLLSLMVLAGCAEQRSPDQSAEPVGAVGLLCGVSPEVDGLEAFSAAQSGGLTYDPYLVWGISQGCFAKHGLGVVNYPIDGAAATKLAALEGGSADVAAEGILEILLSEAAYPTKIRVLSAHNSYSAEKLRLARETDFVDGNRILQTALVVAPEVGFGELEKLASSRVAVNTLTGNTTMGLIEAFKEFGVDPATIEFIELGSTARLQALLRGDVDAATLTGADIGKALESGYNIGVYPTAYLYGPGAVTFWYTTAERWEKDPESLLKFRAGLWDTFRLLNDPANLDTFKRFLVDDYGLSQEAADDFEMHSFADRPASIAELEYYIPFMVRTEMIPPDFQIPAALIVR